MQQAHSSETITLNRENQSKKMFVTNRGLPIGVIVSKDA